MKITTILMAVCLCISCGLYSQSYESGYVINNQNDTIFGLIAVKNNNLSSQKCFLKDVSSDKISTFTPDDISQYRYDNGKYYISATIPNDSTNQKHFLEFLIDGIIDLFYYQDNTGGYYYVRNNDTLTELKNTQYIEKTDNASYLKNKNEYVSTLAPLLQGSTKTCEKLMSTTIDYNSLLSLIKYYHKDMCIEDQCVIYEKKQKIEKMHVGILAGYGSMQVNNTAKSTDVITLNTYETIFSPRLGIFVDFPVPFINNQKLRLKIENAYSLEKQFNKLTYSTGFYSYSVRFWEKRFNMANNVYFTYDLSRTKFKPMLLGGLFIKTTLDSELKVQINAYSPDGKLAFSDLNNGKCTYLNFETGPFAGVGCRTKVFGIPVSFDLRYTYGTGLGSSLKFKVNYLSANMGIALF
ncbi:MAG: hypothetical protein PHR83_11050 [Paludibacter sp.]|nr:hypothetical protein [Paludibacter sp.]